jgi:uncharacterized membrane protein
MAEQQEKDNFWLYIGGLIVTVIILVFLLKSRETEHLQSSAIGEIQQEIEKSIPSRRMKNTAE